MPAADVITREIVLPLTVDDAWSAITSEQQLESWFADEVELDRRPGGEAVFRWEDGCERGALVEEVDEPRRFAFRWSTTEPDDRAAREGGAGTRVEFTLDEVVDGTRVIVVESGFEPVAAPRMQALAGASALALA